MPPGAPSVAPPPAAAPPPVTPTSVAPPPVAEPAPQRQAAEAPPPRVEPSRRQEPAGPSPEEEAAKKRRIEDERREAERREQEEAERAEEAAKKAEEEVRKMQERLKQIGKEKRAAYKMLVLAGIELLVNPEAGVAIVAIKNKLDALRQEEKSLKSQLSPAKGSAREKRSVAGKLGGGAGKIGGAAAGAAAKVGGMFFGPAGIVIIGVTLWFFLSTYGFRPLANWVLVSVITEVLISLIFKEPKKALIVFLLPISIWFLDWINLMTPVYTSIAVVVTTAFMLLAFDVAREAINKGLVVGAFLFGGIMIFWMSAWIQMQAGNNYPHIITAFLMFGYFMWILMKKGGLKWAALAINLIFYSMLFLAPSLFAPPGSPLGDAVEAQLDAWGDMFDMFGRAGKGVYKTVETNYLMGIGEYEEGVEADSERPLGVFLENVGVTSQHVTVGDEIDVFARLRAESFKTEKLLTVSVKCYEEKDEDNINKYGKIKPRAIFSVEEYESQDIDCILDASDIGAKRIVLDTSFTFTTSSFLKAYFMEQDRIRAYKRQNPEPDANPLDQFSITDKNPVAVFTGGPLKIGMGVAQQPIALIRPEEGEPAVETEYGPTLGITLDRNWYDGELLEVSKLKIIVPPGLEIVDVDGKSVKSCTLSSSGEHECTLEGSALKPFFTRKPVITPKTLRVHTGMKNLDKGIETLLAGAPMAIRSFKVEASYTYRIKKEVGVTVRSLEKK